ncbi:MAG: A/G-specific adenine glycosylase [Myxococcota bacterium]
MAGPPKSPKKKPADARARPAKGPDPSIRRVREPLLRWYDAHRRDLPWRRTRDPYAIWISEAMLQQTRVETVIPYWERFLARFPDVGSLARAEQDDVNALWTGLGYYSRARNLKAAAESIVADHGGHLPDTAEGLRTLPGIGRYTAGAVASIAFEREEPLVDGNVVRVFARLEDVDEDTGEKAVVERFWSLAAELVAGPRPGDLNQALMELGATLCTPKRPQCLICPVRAACLGHAAGRAESLPRKAKRTAVRPLRALAVAIDRRGALLAVRRPASGLMAGLWELPGGLLEAGEEAKDHAARIVREQVGLELRELEPVGRIEHVFTHRRLALELFRARAQPGMRVALRDYTAHRWVDAEGLLALAHAGSTRKALRLLGLCDEESARRAQR